MEIYAVLPRITKQIEGISKNRNSAQNYKFRGVDDVYLALNKLLGEHGVTIVPEIMEKTYELRENSKGTLTYRITMNVKYTIYASDGSFITAVIPSEANDTSDKAAPKALSMAYKYLAFQLFCIPTEEKLDTENEEHQLMSRAPAMINEINKSDLAENLEDWIQTNMPEINTMTEAEKTQIRNAIRTKRETFR